MHERSLVRALIAQVVQLAAADVAQVTSIKVSVGEFSGVEPDLLNCAYELLVADTPLARTQLTVQRVPLEAKCEDCDAEFLVQRFRFQCPHCGARRVQVTRGEQFMLESFTIERDE